MFVCLPICNKAATFNLLDSLARCWGDFYEKNEPNSTYTALLILSLCRYLSFPHIDNQHQNGSSRMAKWVQGNELQNKGRSSRTGGWGRGGGCRTGMEWLREARDCDGEENKMQNQQSSNCLLIWRAQCTNLFSFLNVFACVSLFLSLPFFTFIRFNNPKWYLSFSYAIAFHKNMKESGW